MIGQYNIRYPRSKYIMEPPSVLYCDFFFFALDVIFLQVIKCGVGCIHLCGVYIYVCIVWCVSMCDIVWCGVYVCDIVWCGVYIYVCYGVVWCVYICEIVCCVFSIQLCDIIIRNTERDFPGSFYSRRPRGVKTTEGLSNAISLFHLPFPTFYDA